MQTKEILSSSTSKQTQPQSCPETRTAKSVTITNNQIQKENRQGIQSLLLALGIKDDAFALPLIRKLGLSIINELFKSETLNMVWRVQVSE